MGRFMIFMLAFILLAGTIDKCDRKAEEQYGSMKSYEEERAEAIRQAREREEIKESLIKGLRPATVEDYNKWLTGYVESGRTLTHRYDYSMEEALDEWWVATEDFEMVPLYGALRINIIVPEEVFVLGGELGHSNLYLMDEFIQIGGWIPIYTDTVVQ